MMNLGPFNELWVRRQLIWHLAITDLKIKYRNSIFGFAWNVLEPLLLLTVLYVVFSNIFRIDIENYPLYLLIGIVIWNMFARGTSMNTTSIINRTNIITKLYFPREILVVSTTLTSLFMLAFEFIIVALFFIGSQFMPPLAALGIIPIIGVLTLLTLAVSLPLSVLNVYYRDIAIIWSVILQLGFFLSPIIYKLELIPETIRQFLWFNPMVQIIEAAHNLILYDTYPSLESIIYMTVTSSILLVIGIVIFRKYNAFLVERL